MPGPAIEITDVHKSFRDVKALDGLSLTVEQGAVLGFLGPNGAGKTTTLRTLLGLVRPDGGTVSVLGLDPRTQATAVRAQVGVLLESDGLYDRLSARDNLDYHGRIRRLAPSLRASRIEELLRSFGLWERRRDRVAGWSTGMRKKLAVARALLHQPRLLLLDEPFSGLDPMAAVELRQRIVELAGPREVTVVLTTHELAHVERACSRVVVIRAGRVIAEGSPDGLGSGGASVEIEVIGQGLGEDVLAAMQREQLVSSFQVKGQSARITCARDQGAHLGMELVRRGVAIEELRMRRSSLEEAFLSLFAAAGKEDP